VVFRSFLQHPDFVSVMRICGNHSLLKEMESFKNPWTINSLAAIAGEIMFRDKRYIEDTKELISSERKRICTILDRYQSHFKYYVPHANLHSGAYP